MTFLNLIWPSHRPNASPWSRADPLWFWTLFISHMIQLQSPLLTDQLSRRLKICFCQFLLILQVSWSTIAMMGMIGCQMNKSIRLYTWNWFRIYLSWNILNETYLYIYVRIMISSVRPNSNNRDSWRIQLPTLPALSHNSLNVFSNVIFLDTVSQSQITEEYYKPLGICFYM